MRIAIQSNKNLNFNPYFGIITMTINFAVIRPELGYWELEIIDTCHKEIEEEYIDEAGEIKTKIVSKQLGNPVYRPKKISFEKLDELSKILDPETLPSDSMTENINEQLRQGLLIVTQNECLKPSEDSTPMYGSSPEDWFILRN
ncbi:hypothetical protein [Chryseobacterium gambrini]|uniref:hypothetical protein n=1 Tax=Chryseobacterium gambrini TaxID=373672 RepID=UPI003D0F016A